MRGTRATLVTSVLVAALALGGCGDGDHPTKPHSERPTLGACDNCSHGEDPVARGPHVIEGATDGGTVTVLTDHGLDGSLDPARATDPAAVSILSGLVTRSLTQYQYDARAHAMVLVPDLATDLGRHDDDYTEWAFTIRSGARFEDGSRVTARDVARGIRRCVHGRGHPTRPFLDNGPIRSVWVRQHNELMLRLDQPFPDLPYLVALPALGPVQLGAKPGHTAYSRHPAATGPYRIQQYRHGHLLVLVRNQEWDSRTDPVRTQYPDRYVVRAGVPDRRIEHLLLRDTGSAQSTLTFDTMDPGPFRASHALQKRLVRGPTACTTYLAPDNVAMDDPRVRRALVWAYPYDAAIRAAGLIRSVTAIPATTLVPPGVPGRTVLRVRHRSFETNPSAARRILTRAHALGTPVRFTFDSDRAGLRLRDALVRSLRASGFDPKPARALPAGLRTTTRCGLWPSGQQWLGPVLRSSHGHPALGRRMVAIVRLPLDQIPDAWNALDHHVIGHLSPIVPLWYGGVSMAHGSRIQGMADDNVRGMPTWSQIWISDAG